METKVTLVMPGGNEKEYDLENPEDFARYQELASKGLGFESGQTKLKEVSEERDSLQAKQENYDYWQQVLAQAQNGDASGLTASLKQMNINIPNEHKDDPDEFLIDEGDKVVQALKTEISGLKDTLDKRLGVVEGAVFTNYMDSEHARLEAQFNGKDGTPAYDRKTVEAFGLKEGIQDMEKAYKLLNLDAIIEVEQSKVDKHNKKIANVKADEPGGGGEPPKPSKVFDKKSGGYEAANEQWLKDMRQEGKSLYEDNG
jgi:hypothetical protein